MAMEEKQSDTVTSINVVEQNEKNEKKKGRFQVMSVKEGFSRDGNVSLSLAKDGNYTPCVVNMYNFASAFLFSIETQHTIGYGSRHTTEECPEAILVMCIQSIIGVMIQAFMVGVVFAKLSRPKMRAQTLLFSRNAVVCMRDGRLCLMFRVGDMRKSHIISASVRAQIIRHKVTQEGEVMQYYQQDISVGAENGDSSIFFVWPITIVHVITPSSPLYNLSAADMMKERFEIVVILEGTVESTSMTTQARSSYIPSEILWGHRFQSMVSFRKESATHAIDYGLFDSTYEVDTPLCSARDLDEFKRVKEEGGTTVIQLQPTDQIIPGVGPYSPLSASSNGSQFYNVYTTVNGNLFEQNNRFSVRPAPPLPFPCFCHRLTEMSPKLERPAEMRTLQNACSKTVLPSIDYF